MAKKVWISGEQQTVLALLDGRLRSNPDGEYLDIGGEKLTATEVAVAADRIAGALAALGVRHGDRVATLIENSPSAVLAWWGIVRAGAVAVPINTAYKGEYLRHQLTTRARRSSSSSRRLLDRAAQVVDSSRPRARRRHRRRRDRAACRAHSWDDAPASRHAASRRDHPPQSTSATFVYTGGTTGPSKGCMLSHNYHEALARQIGICWQRTADDVVWTPLPLFHFNALVTAVLGPLVFGGRSAIYRQFSVSNFWPEMNRVGATITSTLGTMAYLLAHDVDRPEMPQSGAPEANTSLRLHRRGAAAGRGRPVIRERFGVETFSGAYGVTEASLISWQPPGVANKPNAAGVINDEYFDVRIFDDDDNEVPPRHRGRDRGPPEAPARDVRGLLGPTRGHGRDQPQLVVPHRRHRPDRRRRLPVLRRSQGRLPPPTGREHLAASRSSGSSWATATSPTSPCTPCRAS